jgi:hypothetical protein
VCSRSGADGCVIDLVVNGASPHHFAPCRAVCAGGTRPRSPRVVHMGHARAAPSQRGWSKGHWLRLCSLASAHGATVALGCSVAQMNSVVSQLPLELFQILFQFKSEFNSNTLGFSLNFGIESNCILI